VALLAALVVVAELVLAAGLVVPRLSILAKLAFVAALVGGVLRWPMVAAGAMLVGVASVVSPTIFIRIELAGSGAVVVVAGAGRIPVACRECCTRGSATGMSRG
jgi:hypothetical protein